MRNIDPAVYDSARGTGIAAFTAFLQIALAGYAVYAIRFALKTGGAQSLLLPQATWAVLFPVWLGVVGAFHSDRLTTVISRVVLGISMAALSVMVWMVAFSGNEVTGRFALMNLVAASGALLIAEIARAWLFSGRRLTHSRAGMGAFALFCLSVGLLLAFFVAGPHPYLRYALGAIALFSVLLSLYLRFLRKTAVSPAALHAAVAAVTFLALVAAHEGYSPRP